MFLLFDGYHLFALVVMKIVLVKALSLKMYVLGRSTHREAPSWKFYRTIIICFRKYLKNQDSVLTIFYFD